jgi:hypothetical protein
LFQSFYWWLITSSLTISNFSYCNLFIGGLIDTATREVTDGKTEGDKPSNKNTETTGTTDGKTEGDKSSNKKTETTGTAYHLQFYHQYFLLF